MNNTSVYVNLTRDELDGRLSCFGEFDEGDSICLKSCALNINCAIAKSKFLGYQLMDDTGGFFSHHESFDAE